MIALKILFVVGWFLVSTILAIAGCIIINDYTIEVPLWAAWIVGPVIGLLLGAAGGALGLMTLPIWIWLL